MEQVSTIGLDIAKHVFQVQSGWCRAPADGDDQPDPSLSDRTRHRRQGRSTCPTQITLRHIGEPQGRDIAANGQADPGSL